MTNIDTMKPIIAGAISNPAGTCGNGCEGNAYQIEIRRLNSRIKELEAALITKLAQVETLHLTIQAASAAMAAAPIVIQFHREAIEALRIVQSTEDKMNTKKFNRGDLVRKKSGSEWEGRVVGEYSTELTADGYAVESSAHKGSVQIYPAAALELVQPTEAGGCK